MGSRLERCRSLYALPPRKLVGSPVLTGISPPRSRSRTEVRTNGRACLQSCPDQGLGATLYEPAA